MGITEVFSMGREVVLGISAVVVAGVAWVGLQTWKRELTGKAKFEAAQKMMRLTLKFQANLEGVRSPFLGYAEYANRAKHPEEPESVSHVVDEWYARTNRINAVFENLTQIIEVKWETEILLNESSVQSIEEVVKSLRESYTDLASAIASYFEIRCDEVRTGDLYQDQEWLKGLRETISSVQDDDYKKKVDNAIDILSSTLKQYVR